MPRYSELSFRPKRTTESDLQYIEYRLRKVQQLQARQSWLLRNKEKIREYVKKKKELEEEIFNFYLTCLANETIDQQSFTNLQKDIGIDQMKSEIKKELF